MERRTSTFTQEENPVLASSAGSKGASGLQGAKDIIQDYEYNVKWNGFFYASTICRILVEPLCPKG